MINIAGIRNNIKLNLLKFRLDKELNKTYSIKIKRTIPIIDLIEVNNLKNSLK